MPKRLDIGADGRPIPGRAPYPSAAVPGDVAIFTFPGVVPKGWCLAVRKGPAMTYYKVVRPGDAIPEDAVVAGWPPDG